MESFVVCHRPSSRSAEVWPLCFNSTRAASWKSDSLICCGATDETLIHSWVCPARARTWPCSGMVKYSCQVLEGRKHFDSMAEQHGIKPTIEHYTCMIDLLGRAGHLDEAENMLLSCEGQTDVVGLKTLLNACKSHGDIERARWCFESIVRLDPQEGSAYVLMANAYADASRRTDVDRIEIQRKVAGANKKPAVATIEVNNEVHRFVVGERSEDIALQVERTNARLKQEGGHIPHTKLVLKPMSEKEKEDVLCGHAGEANVSMELLPLLQSWGSETCTCLQEGHKRDAIGDSTASSCTASYRRRAFWPKPCCEYPANVPFHVTKHFLLEVCGPGWLPVVRCQASFHR